MKTIWLWQAEGTDPRYDQKVINMYFGYKPELQDVIFKLQQVLGYIPVVADAFPFSVNPVSTLYHPAPEFEGLVFVLDEDVLVENAAGGELVPHGTILMIEAGASLLFSPPS